jgi:hypothetical protein
MGGVVFDLLDVMNSSPASAIRLLRPLAVDWVPCAWPPKPVRKAILFSPGQTVDGIFRKRSMCCIVSVVTGGRITRLLGQDDHIDPATGIRIDVLSALPYQIVKSIDKFLTAFNAKRPITVQVDRETNDYVTTMGFMGIERKMTVDQLAAKLGDGLQAIQVEVRSARADLVRGKVHEEMLRVVVGMDAGVRPVIVAKFA